MGIFGFVYFAMLNTMMPVLIFIAIALSLLPVMTHVWPGGGADRGKLHAAAALQRRFARLPARLGHRRRSVAVHRDVAVCHLSSRAFRSPSTSWLCAIIGIVATALLTDYTNKDISDEYEAV